MWLTTQYSSTRYPGVRDGDDDVLWRVVPEWFELFSYGESRPVMYRIVGYDRLLSDEEVDEASCALSVKYFDNTEQCPLAP